MSHFTVTVCLPSEGIPDLARAVRIGNAAILKNAVETKLERALAPFDENKEAEPYREYEKGDSEDYWLYTSLQRYAEEYANGTGIKPYKPDGLFSFSSDSSRDTEAVQREKQRQMAELFHSLPDQVTWADIARVYQEAFPEESGDTPIPDKSGRAYTMSTYNPESKWDWYQIGGRWPGRFTYHHKYINLTIQGERSWASEGVVVMPLHCDGGQKSALDLDAMRNESAWRAREEYTKYEAVVTGTPEALPWSTFTDNVSEGNGYTINRAREEYGTQPRIKALQENQEFMFVDNEDFQCGEKLYVERARARAVPGWALLTTDGRWLAPGDMGWWGMSTDTEGSRIGYWETANAYIEALPDDAWLVSVDCHI